MTPATIARALECFARATALDASYALAWAGIADAWASQLFRSDTRPSDVEAEARRAAEQALKHGENVAEAHTAMALIHFLFDWNWLERARVVRDVHLIYVPMDPKWDPFRMKEPFQDVLRRAGLTS
jgi:hypothetical protein